MIDDLNCVFFCRFRVDCVLNLNIDFCISVKPNYEVIENRTGLSDDICKQRINFMIQTFGIMN